MFTAFNNFAFFILMTFFSMGSMNYLRLLELYSFNNEPKAHSSFLRVFLVPSLLSKRMLNHWMRACSLWSLGWWLLLANRVVVSRRKIRGARNFIFYGVPTFPWFVRELLSSCELEPAVATTASGETLSLGATKSSAILSTSLTILYFPPWEASQVSMITASIDVWTVLAPHPGLSLLLMYVCFGPLMGLDLYKCFVGKKLVL